MPTKEELFQHMANNLADAREVYEEFWFSWNTIGGSSYEGILWEIDNLTYIVLCTDGKERAV